MSSGDYAILIQRPISATMLALTASLCIVALAPILRDADGWRRRLGLER